MILILSCSIDPVSKSRILAKLALEKLQHTSHETAFIDMVDYPLPFCGDGSTHDVKELNDLRELILKASGILIATPIYNYDVNAVLKNLIELTGSAWSDKIVGFICSAGGIRSYMSIMPFANSLMLDFRCVIIPRFVYADPSSFHEDKIHPSITDRLDQLLETLSRFVTALS